MMNSLSDWILCRFAISLTEVAKYLTAGTIGGAAQLIVGHPFNTIKVKLQSQPTPPTGQLPRYSGVIDAVKQTLAAEGARGLYKGMGAPLATVEALNVVLFTVAAGAGAGFAVAILATPTELIKCRMHLATPTELIKCRMHAQSALADGAVTAAVKYSGPLDVAKQVWRSEGGARGLFKGLIPAMAREVPRMQPCLVFSWRCVLGSFWALVYPTDVIKRVIQIDDYKNPKYSGSIDAFKRIVNTEEFGGLYKGFGPAMTLSVMSPISF
ncbi:putative mitochondrial carrier domain superfamily [Helianthus anomalus]